MARSTRGLYKRGNTWWMTYRDAVGMQRFESCKTSNKKEAEQRLIDRRKEAMEGIVPAPAIKPIALDDLKERYLSYVGHQRGVATKHYHFAHFKRVWGSPPIHSLTVEVLDQYRALRLSEKVGPATLVQNKFLKCLPLVSRMGRSSTPVRGVATPCHPQAGGVVW